jgi:hypothetical protein
MSLAFCPEPEAFLRVNYMLILQSFRGSPEGHWTLAPRAAVVW